jgi:hopanoid biosynthesis associated RND transporter like protein HpnN
MRRRSRLRGGPQLRRSPVSTAMRSRLPLRHRAFQALARLDTQRPWLVLFAALLLSIVSILYTKAHLEFRTGQDDLVSGSGSDARNYHRYTREFPDLDGLIVIVRADPNPARAESFAETLAAQLTPDHANVKSVFYRIDPELLSDRALLYLDRDDINELSSRVRENRGLIERYARDPSLANLFGLMNEQTSHAMVSSMVTGLLGDQPAGGKSAESLGSLGPALRFVNAVLEGMLRSAGERFQSPWAYLTSAGGGGGVLRDGYVATDNGKYLLMHIAPGDGVEGGADAVDVIQGDLDRVRAQFPDVEAGMTGGPALARAEARSTQRDIALASVLAIASNLLLIIIPFGGLVRPLFAIVALMVGVAWSFGFTTLAVGHLNLLSAVFTSILAGIGINFPIHLMARYEEARRAGHSMPDAIELSVVNTGTGVVASASIMALAFLTPMFTDFKGIAELGLVSAAGLFLCLISALLVFPALVAIRDRGRAAPKSPSGRDNGRPAMMERLFARPGVILMASAAITLGALLLVRDMRFDQNLLKLQDEHSEAVRFEEKLLKDSGRSSWFAVAFAGNLAEAERKAASFRALPEVADAETIASYIPREQAEKRAVLAGLRPVIDPIAVRPIAVRPPAAADSPRLLRALKDFDFRIGGGRPDRPDEVKGTSLMVEQAVARLESDSDAFRDFERAMANDFARKVALFKRSLAPGEANERNLPALLRSRFVGTSGAYLVQIYPRGDIWDDAPLQRFVDALRTVDPDVTGPPIQTWSIASVMRRGYERAAILALFGVVMLVLLDFRNLRDTALAIVPLVCGSLWLLEAMGWLGWEFNLANLFAVPILIGTSVDNGVNMVYRWREEHDKSQLILTRAVGKSVTICSLTTIAGFAALIPASHRGISSLGWMLSLGVTLILIATLIVLPALFSLIGRRLRDQAAPESAAPPRRLAGGRVLILLLAAAAAAVMLASLQASADDTPKALIKSAEKLIEEAAAQNPLNTAGVYDAIALLKRVIRIDPRDDEAYVDLGYAYGMLKDTDQAIDMYQQAVKINPSPANLKELTDVYLRAGRPQDALMAVNAAIAKSPNTAGLYNARGMALHDLMRFDEAEKDFRKALSLDPNSVVARSNLEELAGESKKAISRSTVSSKAPDAGKQ